MTTTFEELLARDGYLVYRTRGVSMEPMLRQNRDLVVIRVPASRLKKYDVALYRRGDAHVLHRVVAVRDDHYLVRGDNTYALETVPEAAVVGVLSAFTRKGRRHSAAEWPFRAYGRLWCALYPLRHAAVALRRLAGKALRRLGLRR